MPPDIFWKLQQWQNQSATSQVVSKWRIPQIHEENQTPNLRRLGDELLDVVLAEAAVAGVVEFPHHRHRLRLPHRHHPHRLRRAPRPLRRLRRAPQHRPQRRRRRALRRSRRHPSSSSSSATSPSPMVAYRLCAHTNPRLKPSRVATRAEPSRPGVRWALAHDGEWAEPFEREPHVSSSSRATFHPRLSSGRHVAGSGQHTGDLLVSVVEAMPPRGCRGGGGCGGDGRGGVAGVGGDQPGPGAGGALALLLAQEAARQRAGVPCAADGRRWRWGRAAARPRAVDPVVPVDPRRAPALRGRRAAAPRPRRARRRPPLQIRVRMCSTDLHLL